MKSLLEQISQRMYGAIAQMGVEGNPLVRPAQDEKFGDYQSNCAMGLAKQLGQKPRDVAAALVGNLQIDDMCEAPEIAGPGFINFRLKPAFLASALAAIPAKAADTPDRLGIDTADRSETVVVDLSSPNLAKEMHVGHLRSTVIGDCIARLLEFQGHTVHRENHVGDWGTQFGMLVAHLRHVRPEVIDRPDDLEITDLESFYVEAKARFDADEAFRKESRDTVVALQQGDPTTRRIWQAFCDESLRHCHAIYDRLDVKLTDRGESYYTELMEEVVARLERIKGEGGLGGRVADSEGALCVFLDGFKTREGERLPMIVRKSDGGFNYATSDLATIIHRIETLGAKRIIYVVGIAQKQHFEMLFAAVRLLGWAGDDATLIHCGFGNMLAEDGRPFKTREGGTVKLKTLLDDAVARARKVVEKAKQEQGGRTPDIDESQIERIAETVGFSAIKYFDLQHALNSDYRFSPDTMLAMEGNTAPYMLYAYARIRSIGRKAGIELDALPAGVGIEFTHPTEIALGKALLRFAESLDTACTDLRPNVLTDYLYDLAKTFSRFYDKKQGVRVIDATPERVRLSRLRLCDLTARTLKLGLSLLGINTLEQM